MAFAFQCIMYVFMLCWATFISNGSPYATGPLSCLSVSLVYCGQTVGWSKMSLGTEVGLGPGNIVLDGDPTSPRKWAHQPLAFRPMSIVAKRSPISTTAELLLYVLSSESRYASENATYTLES